MNVIESEFEVLEGPDDKAEKFSKNEFGYRSIHYIVKLNQKRAELPECRKFKDLRAEIQIRTIIENTWAEIDHHWNYKPDIEDDPMDEMLKRRFFALMAVLELVDQEFDLIRESIQDKSKSREIDPDAIQDLARFSGLYGDICKYLYDNERYEELVNVSKIAVNYDKTNVKAWINMASGLFILEKDEELLEIYEKIINLEPNNIIPYIGKAFLFSDLGEYKKALFLYDEALKLEPKNIFSIVNKGITLAYLGNNKEALDWIDKAIEYNPEYNYALVSKGNVLDDLGNSEDAIKLYDKALELTPDYNRAIENKGEALLKLEKYEEASPLFDKILEDDPHNVHALINKGIVLANTENPQEAINFFDRVLEFQSKNIHALVNKAKVLTDLGKFDEALEWINKTLKIEPDDYVALYHKGRVLDELGRSEEAEKLYERVFKPERFYEFFNQRKFLYESELEPEDIQALMGILIAKDGEHKKAIKWINSALDHNPKNKIALMGKSFALEKIGKYDDALNILNTFLPKSPYDGLVLYRIARIQSLKGNNEIALENLASAINLNVLYKSKAKNDKAFEKIKETNEFKKFTS